MRFDADLVVSVFEVNIRVVGGLISGHAMMLEVCDILHVPGTACLVDYQPSQYDTKCDYLSQLLARPAEWRPKHALMGTYSDQLLRKAMDIADRLMPAFNTKVWHAASDIEGCLCFMVTRQ